MKEKKEESLKPHKPIVLVVLDGFGISNEKYGNPVLETQKPNLESFERKYPFTTLQASGVAVGLPWGEAGNSEVGHLTIGAGRVVYHHLPRIVFSIQDGSFYSNPELLGAAEHAKKNASRFHIAALVSTGSVHSYIDHLYALFEFTKRAHIPEVYLHIFTDGKDAPPNEGGKFIPALEERIKKLYPNITISSVIGRTYPMDRDEKWDRIKKAYRLMVEGEGEPIVSAGAYVKDSYRKDIFDAFIEPAFVKDVSGNPIGVVGDNDALIFANFREDSMREIVSAFTKDVFDYFPRRKLLNLYVATMTEYAEGLSEHVLFPPIEIRYPLSRVIGESGMKQMHVAETEKYAHVTYFFNGGKETRFSGEEWELIPSIATAKYDEFPEMRARDIADQVIVNLPLHEFILVNFANADMVGHTGNFQALKGAIAILDREIGRIKDAVLAYEDGVLIVTGDHGNAEMKMARVTGEILTEHTINPVPFYLVAREFERARERTEKEIREERMEVGGILTDIAPTILELLGLQKPDEMTGKSLLKFLKKQIEN